MVGFPEKKYLKHIASIAVCLGLVIPLGCSRGESSKAKDSPRSDANAKAEKKLPEEKPKPLSGREILERMVAAYQNATSYADHGQVRLDFVVGGHKGGDVAPFSLALARPNKLRLEAYQATIVCDGKDFFAEIKDIPDYALRKPAPERLVFSMLFTDPLLEDAWTRGFGGSMPQVLLLLGKDPMKSLLSGTEEVAVMEAGEIDGHACHRLRFERPEGTATFWIDRENYVLRRVVMPTDPIRQDLSQEGPVESISLVADFFNARLDGEIAPETFEFKPPKGAKTMKSFPPAPMRMLGKKAPKLEFFDLDGKPVTLQSPAGKVVVLNFWATWCEPCRRTLPDFEKIRRQYKDNPKVVFYAVSVDQPQTDNKQLVKTFEQLKVNAPILRDPKQSATAMQFIGIPTLFVIGADGVVQHCEMGGNPRGTEDLAAKIDALLAGKNVFEKSFREFMEAYAGMIEAQLSSEGEASSDKRVLGEQALPEVKTAPRSDPARLKLAPLWKCAEVKSPGNILVVRDGDGPVRLMVVEDWKSVAEVGLDGKLIALHKLELDENEIVGSMRAAVGADGKRYFVAFLLSQQRCHVYDENWKLVAHYPEDALESPHRGIADVELGDLDGDGKLNVYVSYWGLVGVQCASLEGKRLWANRSLSEVACIAIGGPNAQGRRDLYCAGGAGEIVVLDAKGERNGEISVRNRFFHWIASADLRGDGRGQWCGMSAKKTGDNIAVGFSLSSEELWSYTLPAGVPQIPIEPIVPGRVTRDGPGQWLLPGLDGSIHVVSADGVPLDRFNYGAELHGLTTVEIGGRPALVVATAGGVEAWEVK
ncbi:MAG: redoxin domain-containing protein [Planctomycetes bacterium]|nr:redoxin domain-containing protein [Planctomycetota bacterium]